MLLERSWIMVPRPGAYTIIYKLSVCKFDTFELSRKTGNCEKLWETTTNRKQCKKILNIWIWTQKTVNNRMRLYFNLKQCSHLRLWHLTQFYSKLMWSHKPLDFIICACCWCLWFSKQSLRLSVLRENSYLVNLRV